MLSDKPSPDKQYRMIEYHFDHGAFGYSRTFWAIIPKNADTTKLNLVDYIVPDGCKTKGWTANGEAIIENWEPSYDKETNVDLKTGDVFDGVKVVLE